MSFSKPSTSVDVTETDAKSRNVTRVGSQSFSVADARQTDHANVAQRTTNDVMAQNAFRDNATLEGQFAHFIKYMENFSQQFADEIKRVFDLPKLLKDFNELDWKRKILVVLALIALMGLIGWGTWELACWVYPKIIAFFGSTEGSHVMNDLGDYLEILRDSSLVAVFGGVLLNAVSAVNDARRGPNPVEIHEVEVDADDLNTASFEMEEIASQRIPEDVVQRFSTALVQSLSSGLPKE